MKSFEYYLEKEIDNSKFEDCCYIARREQRERINEQTRINKRDKLIDFGLFILLVFCFITIICACVDAFHKEEELMIEVQEEVVQYSQSSVRGDHIPAKGFASLEAAIEAGEYPANHAVFKVTHYCGCSVCCGTYSDGSESKAVGAAGKRLEALVSVAVDTSVIPLGTVLHDAEGRLYRAEDTGSAIKGSRIDLFVGNHEEALKLGVKEMEFWW